MNGDLSREEMKTFVLKVYKERRFLSRSLRDTGSALKTLDGILIVLGIIILFFISLSVFRVSLGASLTSVYSLGLALSFIFKNSASNVSDPHLLAMGAFCS
jgi:small-conductance mechanosensitive channel